MVIMGFEHGFLCRIGVELIYLQFWWTLMEKRAVIVETETLRCRNHWTTQWISNLTLNSWIWRIYHRKYIWWPLWIHSHPSRMTASWPSWPSVGPKAAWLEPNHKMEWRCRIFRHSMDWFKEKSIGTNYFFSPMKSNLFKQSIETHQPVDGWYMLIWVWIGNLLPPLDGLWYQQEYFWSMTHGTYSFSHIPNRFHMSDLFGWSIKNWVPSKVGWLTLKKTNSCGFVDLIWLVVYLPLWKKYEWKSVGIMKFPIYGKS